MQTKETSLQLIYAPQVDVVSRQQMSVPNSIPYIPSDATPESLVEFASRTCYMSYGKYEKVTPTAGIAGRSVGGHFLVKGRADQGEHIRRLIDVGHESVLEHAVIGLYIQGVSRNLTHELVRHRVGAGYSQLSTRYVDESEVAFVVPPLYLHCDDDTLLDGFIDLCIHSLREYRDVVAKLQAFVPYGDGTLPTKRMREAARCSLIGNVETKIQVTGNMRYWRHFLKLRGGVDSDLEIRRLAVEVFRVLRTEAPGLLFDFEESGDEFGPTVLLAKGEDNV